MKEALVGGALIGVAGILLMWSHGRVMGISGILSGVLIQPKTPWRVIFLIGLAVGALLIPVFGFL